MLALGGVSIVLAAAPVMALWDAVGPAELSLQAFLWFKAAFAAVLAFLVTPPLAWWALVRASRRRFSAQPNP